MIEVNQIYNADCLDILKDIPNNYFDLCLTDPPYGDGTGNLKRLGNVNIARPTIFQKKDWDNDIPTKEIFDEIFRVSKNQIIFGGNYFVEYLKNSSCWLVWDKNNTGNYADCELAWTNFKSAVRKYKWTWNGMLQEDMKHKEIRIHPTQKPVGLLKQILRDYYKEGIVLDCFSGSGSTAIACYDLNIPFVAIEKDKDYYDKSVERLEIARSQLRLF